MYLLVAEDADGHVHVHADEDAGNAGWIRTERSVDWGSCCSPGAAGIRGIAGASVDGAEGTHYGGDRCAHAAALQAAPCTRRCAAMLCSSKRFLGLPVWASVPAGTTNVSRWTKRKIEIKLVKVFIFTDV